MSLSLKDLKPAGYNPRTISSRRLSALSKSYATYGDLSGVVFNLRTKTLVSGHQRLKTLDGKKTKIVTHKQTDQFGTVEVGHIVVQEKGGTFNIPLRIVDWSDKKTEMAANIAANAHGGEFDKDKLGKVLKKLDLGSFDIEAIGLDPLTIRSLAKPDVDLPKNGHGDRSRADDSEFPEYGEDTFEFDCTCPRCGYQWNNKGSGKKAAKETVSAKPKKSAIEKTARRVEEKKQRDRPKRVG